MLLKKVAADYGTGVIMTRQKLWFPSVSRFSFVFTLLCQGKGEVDTSAGWLSEAKTQRRPRARERESEKGGVYLCCFVVFVSFFQAGQGKKKTRREGDDG